ncbi:MAG: hypothetical protein R3F11_25805 [Verrucomicrobiales bacterium]
MSAKIDPALHKEKKPEWIKVRLPRDPFSDPPRGWSPTCAHTVCEGAMPEPVGMLEREDGDVHDRGRPLHAGVRV